MQSDFSKACSSGDLNKVKEIIDNDINFIINIHYLDEHYFDLAIKNNHIDVAKYLVSLAPIRGKIFKDYSQYYNNNLSYCNLNTLQYLVSIESKFVKLEFSSELFRNACRKGQLDIVQWLISLEDKYGEIDIHEYMDLTFHEACKYGHIEVARYLISLEPTHGNINIHETNSKHIDNPDDRESEFYHMMKFNKGAFFEALKNNHVDILNYLISLEETHGKIKLKNDYFIELCVYGNIDMIKYLLSLEKTHNKIDIHTKNELGLRHICYHNKDLEYVKFLFSLEKTHDIFNIHVLDEDIFVNLMSNNRIDIVKYLFSLEDTHGKINIHIKNDIVLKNICSDEIFNGLIFLLELDYNYYYKYIYTNKLELLYPVLESFTFNKRKYVLCN